MKTKDLVGSVLGTVIKFVIIIGAIILIYGGATTCYDYGYRIFMEPPMATEDYAQTVEVTIDGSITPRQMGEMLLSKGLIRDEKLFILQFYLSEFREDLKAGTYELSTDMTVEEMMEVMSTEPEEE